MGLFSKSKEKKELALVFDIGSSSVGGALFEINKTGTPKIILSLREPIPLEKKIEIDRFLFLTSKALDSLVRKICRQGIGRPDKIFCVLSSPWYASQTRSIRLEKNTPFIFTSKLADGLIKKEISLFEEEHLSQFSTTENKVNLIEFKNMKTLLNGYATADPEEKKASKLQMVVFISMSGEKILKSIQDVIVRHFHTENIKFSSFAIASYVVIRDFFPREGNFLLLDVGGEVTDIAVVKEDILTGSISFPLGYNFMIRKLAGGLRVSLDEAKSLLTLYREEHATEATLKKLEPIISALKKEWLTAFQNSLANLSSDISIPANIFITIDKELADFFIKIIQAEQFNQYTLTESEFKIILLDSETLHGLASFEGEVERDPFLALEAVYLNRFIC